VSSRSGTLIMKCCTRSSWLAWEHQPVFGVGGDPINGTNFIDVLEMFEHDPQTEKVVMIGEIGGTDEDKAG